MDLLNKQLNRLPKSRMSFLKKLVLKYRLYSMHFEEFFGVLFEQKIKYVPVALVSLIFILSGVPVYAYTSPKVNESHFLFPIKKEIEEIELKMADSDSEKIEKYEKFSERRLDEAELISKEIEDDDDRLALSNTIKEAIELKTKAKDISLAVGSGATDDNEKSENSALKQREKLSNIALSVGIEEKEDLVEDIAVAIDFVSEEPESKKETKLGVASSSLEKENSKNKENNNNANKSKADVLELKEKVESLKNDLKEEYDEEDVKTLFERLDKRIETVNDALENEPEKNINGMVNSTKAITNNAKYFIKKKESDIKNSSSNSNSSNNSSSSKGSGKSKNK